MQNAQHPVGEIVEIVTALAPEAVGILHQLRASVLLHALDRGFRRQPSRDGLAHAPRPAAVVGEHLHRLDDFLMLVARRFVVDEEAVDILPKPQERLVQALELGGNVVGEELKNLGARIVERDMPERQPVVQRRARQVMEVSRRSRAGSAAPAKLPDAIISASTIAVVSRASTSSSV